MTALALPPGGFLAANPKAVDMLVCPDGSKATSHPSSSAIGTAYGKWLGCKYMQELALKGQPGTYGLVDFDVFTGSNTWWPGTIFDLPRFDKDVADALKGSDFYFRRTSRTDILNADTSEVFEIKPLRSRDEGPPQLARYLQQLNNVAPMTSSAFGPPKPRTWRGGTWDPSRYQLVVAGGSGKICILHAWHDPQVQGLLVYDISCCPAPKEQPHDQPLLYRTRVKEMPREIEAFRPGLDQLLADAAPVAPGGSTFAVLTTTRFFELFVKGAWDREQDRILQQFGPTPGIGLKKLTLDSMVLAHVLSGPVPDVLTYGSGFIPKQQLDQFFLTMGASILFVDAVGVVVLAAIGLPEVFALAAAGAEWLAGLGASAEVAAMMDTGAAVLEGTLPTVATEAEVALPSLINGSDALYLAARSASGYAVGASTEGAATAGLGILGALVYGAVPADADAAPAGSPKRNAQVPGGELPLLAPVELLTPLQSTIKAGSFVRCGPNKYFVAGMVAADVPM